VQKPSVHSPTTKPSLLHRLATLCARGLIVAVSVLVADLVAIEQKSWWRWLGFSAFNGFTAFRS
jgi:hypothetical protein